MEIDEGEIADDKKIQCRLHDKKIGYSGNTINLTQHLRNHHRQEPVVMHNESRSWTSCGTLKKDTSLRGQTFIPTLSFFARGI